MGSSQLDAVDRGILYHLQVNARTPITDVADAVSVSDNTVRNRIQALEESGVIRGYQVNVDYDAAGVQHYYAFVCTARVNEREQLAETARQQSGVVEVVSLMTGTWNVVVLAAAAGKREISQIARTLDELGLTIEREHLVWEQVRQPFSEFRPDGNG